MTFEIHRNSVGALPNGKIISGKPQINPERMLVSGQPSRESTREPEDFSGSEVTMESSETPLISSESPILSPEYYTSRLSNVAKHRKPSPIWDLFTVEGKPGMLSMLAGKPHPSTFPFEHITLGVRAPDSGEITNLTLQDDELATALQYGMTAGIPELVGWVQTMMETVHSRSAKNERWRVSLGAGSQDLLYKAFNALLNPGDTILVEGPTYPTIMPILDSLGCQYSIVDADEGGISTTDLARVLVNWDASKGPFPRVLYTVPFGSNPAGVTATYARRVEVLRLARQYDIIIMEDDPYYFLYYGDSPRPPSYFTLERQIGGQLGRVLRFDSFSKILSAGFRLGWITGPDALLTAIERHSAVSVVQPNSLSQVIILKLLKEWGLEGFLAHTNRTADFYRKRRDTLKAYLELHLSGLAEWNSPDASMFFWIKLNLSSGSSRPVGDSTGFIREKAISRGVLVLPGATAFPDGRTTSHVRVSFSLLSDEEMEKAVKRLAEAIAEERRRMEEASAPPVQQNPSHFSPQVKIETSVGTTTVTSTWTVVSSKKKRKGQGQSRRGRPGKATRVSN